MGREQGITEEERLRALQEAVGFLQGAQMQLIELHRWVRMERLYALFLRPFAMMRALVLIGVGTLVWWWVGFRGMGGFSLGVLCTMVPILVMVWRARGGEDWSGFLADIHCADEVILALGEGHLLAWPATHPEEGIEEGASWGAVWGWVELRKAQLTVELTQRSWTHKRESTTTHDK